MITNHWGKYVDSEVAITGVVSNNSVEWLSDEIFDGIDITLDEAIDAYRVENPNATDDDVSSEFDMWESQDDTILIGAWRKDKDGLYEPDETGEYAAIVRESVTQVVWSHNTKRVALCSPCYPGQGDLDSEGPYLAYDLPADMYGSHDN